jgi:hypothetical protein
MWFLVSVVKGSKYYEADSQIDNRMLISDTTEMIVSGYSTGTGSYRFEMRRGNEAFTLQELSKGINKEAMTAKFLHLAAELGARTLGAAA